MKPYYDHDGITIYNADCRDVLPLLDPVDLVLTDPPYGINAARHRHSEKDGWRDYGTPEEALWDSERPSDGFIAEVVAAGKAAVVWGGNYFTLPPSQGWFVWDKGQSDFSLADCELAWTTEDRATRRLFYPRSRATNEGREHPTQKPIALMRWCIEKFPNANTILDPFMGSGTTLRAAKDLGRKAIGIEIEERYCEIAANRMAQGVLL
jgi:DNA modification methylase